MARRQQEEFSFTPLPRERRSAKIQRYMVALAIAAVIAASLIGVVSVASIAIAPLLQRSDADLLPVSAPSSDDNNTRDLKPAPPRAP